MSATVTAPGASFSGYHATMPAGGLTQPSAVGPSTFLPPLEARTTGITASAAVAASPRDSATTTARNALRLCVGGGLICPPPYQRPYHNTTRFTQDPTFIGARVRPSGRWAGRLGKRPELRWA